MIKLFIDCDPGVDDAYAILMAANSQDVEIIGLSSTFGNASLENATTNLLGLKANLNIDAPVYKGSSDPLLFKKHNYGFFHGKTGLGNYQIDTKGQKVDDDYAWDGIYEACKANPNQVTIVTLGPLTNLAKTILKYEDFVDYVKEVYIMGGSADYGNEGIYGEVNFMNDPQAAKVVFDSKIKKTMVGLDAGRTTTLNTEEVEKVISLTKENYPVLLDGIEYYNNSQIKAKADGLVINDAMAMYVALSNNYEYDFLPVQIEVNPGLSFGRSVIDRRPYTPFEANTKIVKTIDKNAYFDKIIEVLSN